MSFELLEFQDKVVSEYAALKKLLDASHGISSVPDFRFGWGGTGKLSKWFNRVSTDWLTATMKTFEKRGALMCLEKDDVKKYSETSTATISHPEVKKLLRPLLGKIDESLLFEQEEVVEIVKIVTGQLTTEENMRKYSIKPDAFLFAFMVYDILRTGTSNYCAEPPETE